MTERSEWYCAWLLQQWKRRVAPKIRKAYATKDPAERLRLLKEAAPFIPHRDGTAKVIAELERELAP